MHKKVKGVKYNVAKRNFVFNCLHKCKEMVVTQQKIGLSTYDDKRYLVSDSTDTLNTLGL